jgi:hypothetical protein
MTEENANKDIQIGDKMPDGSIYAGVSPGTDKPMYVTAKDAGLMMEFGQAAGYASKLAMHGHQDWCVPTIAELTVLFRNREKGALKGTFNSAASKAGFYWSSTPTDDGDCTAWGQRFVGRGFNDKTENHSFADFDDTASVRCVRYGDKPAI